MEDAETGTAVRQYTATVPEEADSLPSALRGATASGRAAPAAPIGRARMAARNLLRASSMDSPAPVVGAQRMCAPICTSILRCQARGCSAAREYGTAAHGGSLRPPGGFTVCTGKVDEVARVTKARSRSTTVTAKARMTVKKNPSSAAECAASLLGSPPSSSPKHIGIISTREVKDAWTMEVVISSLSDARVDPRTSNAWADVGAGGSMQQQSMSAVGRAAVPRVAQCPFVVRCPPLATRHPTAQFRRARSSPAPRAS